VRVSGSINKRTAILVLGLLVSACGVKTEEKPVSAAKTVHSVISPGGYKATAIPNPAAEGEGSTLLTKGESRFGELPSAYPVSFSPVADILLVREWVAADDTRHYLLNIGAGEMQKPTGSPHRVFGGRYVKAVHWSPDGEKITLYYHEDLAGLASETFHVNDLL
jgi:hypothetical protein